MQLIKKMIAASLALALVLSMSGCYWKGNTKHQSEQIILDALEERYGEEFFIQQMAVRSSRGGRPLAAYCSPKDDEEIIFEVEYYEISGLRDTYIPMIVWREMKEKIDTVLAQYYEDFAVEVEIDNLVSSHEFGITNAEEHLESYRTAHYDSAEYYGCQQFQLGIRMGAQLMMELMVLFERQ